jgi:hypothetical protein
MATNQDLSAVRAAIGHEALYRLKLALDRHGVPSELVGGSGAPGRAGRIWPRLVLREYGTPAGTVPADAVFYYGAGEQLPGTHRQGNDTRDQAVYVWGPGLEYDAAALEATPAAAAVAQSFGRRHGQLPRVAFAPGMLRWHRFGRRPRDRTVQDDRPWRLVVSVLTRATPLGVEPWRVVRTYHSQLVGTVARGGRRWRARCQQCPAEEDRGSRGEAGLALAAHFTTHLHVQPYQEAPQR